MNTTQEHNLRIGTQVRYTGEPAQIAPVGRFKLNSRVIQTGEIGTVEWSAFVRYGEVYVRFDGVTGSAGMVPVTDLEVVTDA